MQRYLKNTAMLDFNAREIGDLIKAQKWEELDDYNKIGAIYDFVQNKIVLGYNK